MSAAVEGQDYYFNEAGLLVMTEASHLERGHCCGNHCQHCPYEYAEVANPPLPAGGLDIRPTVSADAAGIALARRRGYAATFGAQFTDPGRDLVPYLDATFSQAAIEARIQAADGIWWSLVDAEGQVWGVCELQLKPEPNAPSGMCLRSFYVRRAARRDGAAEALLRVAVEEAAARGARQVWVACLKGNCLNIAFFTRHGFAIMDSREERVGRELLEFHLMARGV